MAGLMLGLSGAPPPEPVAASPLDEADIRDFIQRCNNCTRAVAEDYLRSTNNSLEDAIQRYWEEFDSTPSKPIRAAASIKKAKAGGGRAGKENKRQTTPKSSRTKDSASSAIAEKSLSDKDFYKKFASLVDEFVSAVSSKRPFRQLKELTVKADQVYSEWTKRRSSKSDLVNRLSFKHLPIDGRTPLAYAVAQNYQQVVHDLIALGANPDKVMQSDEVSEEAWDDLDPLSPGQPTTALVIAATNTKRDGTELVRVLLSKGSSPDELEAAGIDIKYLNRSKRYWIYKSQRIKKPSLDIIKELKYQAPADTFHELDYAVIGEETAIATVKKVLYSRFLANSSKSPLVMLMCGPPGHGKTYFSENMARSVVGEDNFKFISMSQVRDDADLFGGNLGGMGKYGTEGQLTSWLRERQDRPTIVFLDEFEKTFGLHSALGHNQDKKIYQSFLEPWQDGKLTDQGRRTDGSHGGSRIDCSQTIWILTSNWGQDEIIKFAQINKDRVYGSITADDADWLQTHLAKKSLKGLIQQHFETLTRTGDLKALARRIDYIVPFMPFTKIEQAIVADTCCREAFGLYREPKIVNCPQKYRRFCGNLYLRHSKEYCNYVAHQYDESEGTSIIAAVVQEVNGLFLQKLVQEELVMTDEEKERIFDTEKRDQKGEPSFWIHYDRELEQVRVTRNMPVGEDEPDDLFDDIECDVKPVQEEGDGTGEDEEFASEDGYAETDDAKEEMPEYRNNGDDAF
eukprot:Stramenopile-MAST_4_protein_67